MRGGERVPLAAPRPDERRGHVGEVGDRTVGVAPLDPGLAAAIRLDAFADLPFGVLWAAWLQVAALRHVPVRRLAVEDPARADDAREPDVDHAPRRLDVEPDAKAEEEDGHGCEHPCRPDGAEEPRTSPEADPEPADEEVPEHGVDERDAAKDLPAVEEGERDGEAEEHEEIEVARRQRPAQVAEPDEEEETESKPDVGLEQRLPAERPLVAPGHLPRDLRPRPRLGHLTARVLDYGLRNLARPARPPSRATCARPRRTLRRWSDPADTGRATRRFWGSRARVRPPGAL